MEPKDPAPSPPTEAANDGAPEEEGLPTVHVAMAKEAAHLFHSRRFSECLDVLRKLLTMKRKGDSKGEDPKVLHNIAVAEYFQDGGSDPKKLMDALYAVKDKCEELWCTSEEQMEDSGSTGSSSIRESRGINTLHYFSVVDTGNVASADEFDTSVVTFNIAVTLYHLRRYQDASSVLWLLYQNVASIDEAIALHVCILLLDTTLALQDASKAADVIQYLEKAFGGSLINQGDNGSIVQHQSSNQGMKIFSATSNNSITAQDGSGSDSSGNISETPLVGTLSDDALEYEYLYSTLDSGGQNLGRPTSNDISKASVNWGAPWIDLKQKLHLYKVRLLLLTGNQKSAMREVKLAMNDVRGRDSSTELILKAQLEYSRGNHSKAIKLLQASRNRTDTATEIIFNNNLGCIYHEFGKNTLSCQSFSTALSSSRTLLSEKPLKLSTFSQDKSLFISYNLGLQSLLSGEPASAAHYFSKAAPMFDSRPLFWLRTAECSLLALKKGLLMKTDNPSSGKGIKLHVVGSGKGRKLIIDDSSIRNIYSDSNSHERYVSNMLSLRSARRSLTTALLLLDKSDGSAATDYDPKEARATPGSSTTFQSSVESYADMCLNVSHMIRQAVLADLAFVTLCLKEPMGALSASRSLLRVPECSRIHLFLGRVYAAEALCRLGRIQEAMDQISGYVSGGAHVELPYSSVEREPLGPEEARGALFTNLAAVFAMQGDLEQAARFAKDAVSRLPNDPRAVLASVYVDLRQGNAGDAVAKLTESRHVRFLRSAVSLIN